MRLATLKEGSVIAISRHGVIPLKEAGFSGSMLELIKSGEAKRDAINKKINNEKNGIILDNGTIAAPIADPPKIAAIGINYIDHAHETKLEMPKSPLVFAKFRNAITGPSDPIMIPIGITNQVDYEVELGVVIGKTAKNVSKQNAIDYVFGYTILNDVSARDIQFSEIQWVKGKSLDTFCPMGPVIVTKDEIPDPNNLELGCKVNDEIRQQGNTKDMIFGVADLISKLSQIFTLEPGDIIATGTPSGVQYGKDDPSYLKDGDIVASWIKGIGEMINPVIEV